MNCARLLGLRQRPFHQPAFGRGERAPAAGLFDPRPRPGVPPWMGATGKSAPRRSRMFETARRIVALDPRVVVVLVSLEETPELPASLSSVGAAVHLRKQDLSARALREIWTEHGPARMS
jgi:hypothetical protein